MNPTAAQPEWQLIAWRGLRLEVPGDWEVVRHGLSLRRGSLTFVDRVRQRCQIRWTACKKPPRVPHMLEDYHAQQLERDEAAELEDVVLGGGWQGVRQVFDDGRRMTRAARFDAPTSRLLELVLIQHADAEDQETDLAERLAARFVAVEEGGEEGAEGEGGASDAASRTRLFGLDVLTPPGLELVAATSRPGDVTFRWQRPAGRGRSPVEALVRRVGMADAWLPRVDGDLTRWLEAQHRRGRFTFDQGIGGVVTAESLEPGPRLRKWARRLRRRHDRLWLDPAANAVLHVTTLDWPRHPLEPEALSVEAVLPPPAAHREPLAA